MEATVKIKTKNGLYFEGKGQVSKLDGGGAYQEIEEEATSGLGPNDRSEKLSFVHMSADPKFRTLMRIFSLAEQDAFEKDCKIVDGEKVHKRVWIAKRAQEIKALAEEIAEWEWEGL